MGGCTSITRNFDCCCCSLNANDADNQNDIWTVQNGESNGMQQSVIENEQLLRRYTEGRNASPIGRLTPEIHRPIHGFEEPGIQTESHIWVTSRTVQPLYRVNNYSSQRGHKQDNTSSTKQLTQEIHRSKTISTPQPVLEWFEQAYTDTADYHSCAGRTSPIYQPLDPESFNKVNNYSSQRRHRQDNTSSTRQITEEIHRSKTISMPQPVLEWFEQPYTDTADYHSLAGRTSPIYQPLDPALLHKVNNYSSQRGHKQDNTSSTRQLTQEIHRSKTISMPQPVLEWFEQPYTDTADYHSLAGRTSPIYQPLDPESFNKELQLRKHSKGFELEVDDLYPGSFEITMNFTDNEEYGFEVQCDSDLNDLYIRLIMLEAGTSINNSQINEHRWEQDMFDRYCALRGSSIRRPLPDLMLPIRQLSVKLKHFDTVERNFEARLQELNNFLIRS